MELLKKIQDYWEAFWDLIFPPYCTCILCNRQKKTERDTYGMCPSCLREIVFFPKGRWLQTRNIGDGGNSFRMFSVVEYQREIKGLVYRLKYKRETYLAKDMARMMGDLILREGLTGDIIIPVPLYKSRKQQRGFNQAHLLAKYISKYRGISCSNNNLVRNRNTTVMHHLSKRERGKNVKDAFGLKNPMDVANKKIILVDDILTTGSTLEACLKPLVEAGVASVTIVTFARVSSRENIKI